MNKKSRLLGLYITLAFIIAAVATAFRTAACLYHLDYVYGYFDSTVYITVSSILIAAGMCIMLTYAFFKGKQVLRASFSSPSTYVPTGFVGAAMLFFSIELFGEAGELKASGGNSSVLYVITLVTAILALLSIVHFFYNAFIPDAKSDIRAYFAVATVVLLALYAAVLYFSRHTAINAPNKLVDQMAYLFSALFFLYEARISLGREKWSGYAVFGLCAMMLTAYSSIPSLIVYFSRGELISLSLEENLLTFALFIFIFARLLLTVTLPELEGNKSVISMSEFADARQKEVDELESTYSEKYAVQMSIEDLIPTADMPVAEPEGDEFDLPSDNEFITVFIDDGENKDGGTQIELTPEIFEVTHISDGVDATVGDAEISDVKEKDGSDEEDTGN